MKRQTLIILSIPTIILLFAAALIMANEYGNISGQITDSQTQQPIVGASILLVGTNRGANTDLEGRFVIKRVEPGTYTIRVSSVGYRVLELLNIEVKTDLTVSIMNSLTAKSENLEEKIVVEAQTDIIDKFSPNSQSIISKESIPKIPVQNVDQLLQQVPHNVNGVPNGTTGCYVQSQVELKDKYRQNLSCFPPAHGGTATVNGEPFDAMFFENYGVYPFVDTEDDHLSTFAVDVDDASYTLCRSYLERSELPAKDAVRTEEFVNHFNYKYSAPQEETFQVYLEGAPSEFGQNCRLLRIGIKGKKISEQNRKPANLVFVIDVSGSMEREDRLELVKKALHLLVDRLNNNDNIGIVVYGSTGRIVLEPTSVRYKNKILAAIDCLRPDGSTNCQAGLHLGYQMASRWFDHAKTNRIILCSDGVANVGVTDGDDLLKEIKKFADMGITLSTIGFGMGNYNDVLMEKLGNKGNGYYAYVDDLDAARRVFVDNLTGALQVIARDVKIQVDFDPKFVRSYRLLGYENRDVADNQFRDDTVDGGEVGSGHSVTALYEIKLANVNDNWFERTFHRQDIGSIFIRYKNPESGIVEEINRPIPSETFHGRLAQCSPDFKLAVCAAEFAEIMRESYWAKDSDLGQVLRLANEIYNQTPNEDIRELISLITRAKQLKDNEPEIFSNED